MSAFDHVVGLLERVKVQHPGDVLGSCPVTTHGNGRGDRNPSLHVTDGGNKVLLDCKGGCHVQDILLALGLDYPDLFDDLDDRGHLVASYVYQRPDGSPYHINERWQTRSGKRFVQRMADSTEKDIGLHGNKPALYRLPKVLAAAKAGQRIYFVEGEKCVHAGESVGMVTTCASNGVNGWRDYYTTWLKGASEVVVVTDNDNVGKTYAATVVAALRGAGIPSRAVRVKVDGDKADLYDHVAAGFGEADLIGVNLNRLRPEGRAMSEIVATDYPPVRWAVDGLIAAGLTLLGGPPKIGKSFLTLDLAMGVACGGRALTALTCQQGDVLYLSLDNDTERRIKERTLWLWGGVEPDGDVPIEVHIEWPTAHAAIAACQEWVNESPNPLMVVVDTVVRVEPEFEGRPGENSYAASTACLSRWAKFAIDNNIAVVMVHHNKKGEEEDWLNRFTGSVGITATAQTLLFVDAKRGKEEGLLRVSGRDLETDDLELRKVGRQWVAMTAPPPVGEVPQLRVVK